MGDTQLKKWLQQVCPFTEDSLLPIPGDASFRRYFRLRQGDKSYIVMDAALQLDCCEPFEAVAKALLSLGLGVPEIFASDLQQGYMLLSDFGDRLYLKELQAANADSLYKTAMNSLSLLQTCSGVPGWSLPAFAQAFMQRELDEFKLWFLERYLNCSFSPSAEKTLQDTFNQLKDSASQQPQVFIHRDYHSANLMMIPGDKTGIIDFQDAARGPLTYDLVSLLRDCYIDWPDEKVYAWVNYYYEKLAGRAVLSGVDREQFIRWFDWMGLQRHMKALFIFARKYLRDHTPRYLQYLPRTLNYVVTVSGRYPELQHFYDVARQWVLPAFTSAADLKVEG